MPVNKPEAPVRDRANVEVTIKITRDGSRDIGYSAGDILGYAKVEDHMVLGAGQGKVEDNDATFSRLLEQVLTNARSSVLEQLGDHIAVLRKAREEREAKEAALEAAEQA